MLSGSNVCLVGEIRRSPSRYCRDARVYAVLRCAIDRPPALGGSIVCLVGENPASCSVPALYGCEGQGGVTTTATYDNEHPPQPPLSRLESSWSERLPQWMAMGCERLCVHTTTAMCEISAPPRPRPRPWRFPLAILLPG